MRNSFVEDVSKIALSPNSDKIIDSIETHAYGTSKELTYKKWKNKFNNIIKQYKKWFTLMIL